MSVIASCKKKKLADLVAISIAALMSTGSGTAQGADRADDEHALRTRSPIKHLIYIIGENRSFDNVYGAYQPRPGQTIANLLSKGIIKADGTPGRHFARGTQYQVTVPEASGKFFLSPSQKMPYQTLPVPTIAGAQPAGIGVEFGLVDANGVPTALFPQGDPELPAEDQFLLATGGTGSIPRNGADTRIPNVFTLAPGPFPQTSPTLPYDSYEGDTVHQLFQMWQQSDCSVSHATRQNPTGCLHDLYPFVATTFGTAPGHVSTDGGQDMAFYNMNISDAPIFKSLADTYTISDNYHQGIMGGSVTAAFAIGFGDNPFFSDGNGNPAVPTGSIANPDPQAGTINTYQSVGTWIKCSDPAQPGVAAIADYLAALPYRVKTNCEPGAYYPLRDADLPYAANGMLAALTPTTMPPVSQRHIGDALNEKGISWIYYGGGYNATLSVANGANDIVSRVFAAGYCGICNPFQYSKSIMPDPDQRAAHLKDVLDLFADLKNGTLPAVSFVKEDGALEGHPGSGKLDLFEAFVQFVIDLAKSNPRQFAETAIVISFDESGGLYDSGFIQPLDFFGDGPRIPLVVVSPFSTGGRVVHCYSDQVSVVKFIERNWRLEPLTARSRDNLPNPVVDDDNLYVPHNMPAISDLFDMFDFGRGRDN
ncbi:MAG TPA: alkaline phosphatase family protein [Xanthobacteraceae bacterium]|nr:alkaline phosphatase family protein [Xanthobacteraceae bacterium]